MSEFGYIPESPEQSFGNNKGIFTPSDIYDLTRAGNFTQYGQLELIETQTTSDGISAINFTSLSDYNVHFLVWSNITATSGENNTSYRLSNNGGSSYISSGYAFADAFLRPSSPLEQQNNSSTLGFFANNIFDNVSANGYAYFYNLLNPIRYSFATYHGIVNSNTTCSQFGSSVLPTAETHNALQILPNTGTWTAGATLSLYGIKGY